MPIETIIGFVVLAAVCVGLALAFFAVYYRVEDFHISDYRDRESLGRRMDRIETENEQLRKIAETHLGNMAVGLKQSRRTMKKLRAGLKNIESARTGHALAVDAELESIQQRIQNLMNLSAGVRLEGEPPNPSETDAVDADFIDRIAFALRDDAPSPSLGDHRSVREVLSALAQAEADRNNEILGATIAQAERARDLLERDAEGG